MSDKDPARKSRHDERKSRRRVELLAPAGGPAQLAAALAAGADAVYLGLRSLNMRVGGARNFSPRSLPRTVSQAHDAGARLYLTLNSIVFDGELARVRKTVAAAAAAGVDAILASDWAVVAECRAAGMPWHASTQMSCSNSTAAGFLADNGASRIVLARECTMDEVARIARAMRRRGVEIEVFVHGAQCVAVSGRCFLSHDAYGASACRGECQQPCRRRFEIVREAENPGSDRPRAEFSVGPHSVFSARDLCSLRFLPQIVAAGAASLKIEGRGRPPEYVSTVVGAYREALDATLAGRFTQELATELEERCSTVYHRAFGPGLFHGRPARGRAAFTGETENLATRRKRPVGVVQKDWPRAGMAQILVQNIPFGIGDELSIQGPTTGEVRVVVDSIRRDNETLRIAERGNWATIPRPQRVRPGDRVFLLQKS